MTKVELSKLPNNTDELVKFIQAAAELKLELLQRNTSREFILSAENNFILYAVDTDIIKTYTAPWSKGPAVSHGGEGYGCMFPIDEEYLEETAGMAHILGQYVFYELETEWPIFQFPTHVAETERVYDAVARNANIQDRRVEGLLNDFLSELKKEKPLYDIKKIEEIFYNFSNFETTQNENTSDSKQIEKILPDLCSYLLGSRKNYSSELIHYYELLADGARVNLDDVAEIYKYNEKISPIISSLAGSNDIFEWIEESDLETKWLKALVNQKSSGKNERLIENDALALAQLEMTNKRLEKIGGRLIFITGDKSIIKVARNIDMEFASKYIRHIHSFLSDALLNIDQNETEAFNVDHWLDGLLAKYVGLRKFNVADLEELINPQPNSIIYSRLHELSEEMLDVDPNVFNNINDLWNDFRRTAYHYHLALTPDQQKLIATKIQELMESLKQSGDTLTNSAVFERDLADFAHLAYDEVHTKWEGLIISFSQVGIEFLILNSSNSRKPPNVKFDDFDSANKLFSEIQTAGNLSKMTPSFNYRLQKIADDTLAKKIGQNDLGYLHYLVLASVFASEKKWPISASLASRAIHLVKINKVQTVEGKNISGREAFFILSTALRMIAYKAEDFEASRSALKDAISALDQDHLTGSAMCITQERFKAEYFAIDVAEFHFKLLKNQFDSIPIDEKIQELRKFFMGNIGSIDESNLTVAIGINLIQLYSIMLILKTPTAILTEQMNSDMKLVMENIQKLVHPKESPVYETYLIRSYLFFAKLFIDKKEIKRNQKKTINDHFSANNIKDASVTTYDSNRYDRLKKLIDELLSSHEL